MAIFGIGAFYTEDVSGDFLSNNLIGVGWGSDDAPELHQFVRSLKVGDIVYIKSFSPRSPDIIVKGIGIIIDHQILTDQNTPNGLEIGRNVRWLSTEQFRFPKPDEKNNVRANTIYEEYHPEVQQAILQRLFPTFGEAQ